MLPELGGKAVSEFILAPEDDDAALSSSARLARMSLNKALLFEASNAADGFWCMRELKSWYSLSITGGGGRVLLDGARWSGRDAIPSLMAAARSCSMLCVSSDCSMLCATYCVFSWQKGGCIIHDHAGDTRYVDNRIARFIAAAGAIPQLIPLALEGKHDKV